MHGMWEIKEVKMRTDSCRKCGHVFYQDDSNPAIHYSDLEGVCPHCRAQERLKPGDWYQDEKGDYHQKR